MTEAIDKIEALYDWRHDIGGTRRLERNKDIGVDEKFHTYLGRLLLLVASDFISRVRSLSLFRLTSFLEVRLSERLEIVPCHSTEKGTDLFSFSHPDDPALRVTPPTQQALPSLSGVPPPA